MCEHGTTCDVGELHHECASLVLVAANVPLQLGVFVQNVSVLLSDRKVFLPCLPALGEEDVVSIQLFTYRGGKKLASSSEM